VLSVPAGEIVIRPEAVGGPTMRWKYRVEVSGKR
jgi:hypothetical protein